MILPFGSDIRSDDGEKGIEGKLETREGLVSGCGLEGTAMCPLVSILEVLQHGSVRRASVDDAELEECEFEKQQKFGFEVRGQS